MVAGEGWRHSIMGPDGPITLTVMLTAAALTTWGQHSGIKAWPGVVHSLCRSLWADSLNPATIPSR